MATMKRSAHSAPRLGGIGHSGRRLRCAALRRRPRHACDRRAARGSAAYGLSARFAKMRRVNPFSTAMSADEKSRIARR